MKTTTYNTGKEIRSRIGLVVILIVAILSTVKINEFYLNKRQLASENKTPQLKSEPVAIVSLPILNAELISDPVLKVEKWMTSDSYWGAGTNIEQAEAESAIDNPINRTSGVAEEILSSVPATEIERWMMVESYWTGQQISSDEVKEDEVPLGIESWMNDPQYWGTTK